MKYSIVILVSALSFSKVSAQSLSPSVIASTGGFSSNANNSFSYTVGEMTMVQTFSANHSILTQGFQQPYDNATGLMELTKDDFGTFILYPNPAVDNLWFGFQFPEQGSVIVFVTTVLGQGITETYHHNYVSGKIVELANTSTYAPGVYFLTACFVCDKDGAEHIITKKFEIIR